MGSGPGLGRGGVGSGGSVRDSEVGSWRPTMVACRSDTWLGPTALSVGNPTASDGCRINGTESAVAVAAHWRLYVARGWQYMASGGVFRAGYSPPGHFIDVISGCILNVVRL